MKHGKNTHFLPTIHGRLLRS